MQDRFFVNLPNYLSLDDRSAASQPNIDRLIAIAESNHDVINQNAISEFKEQVKVPASRDSACSEFYQKLLEVQTSMLGRSSALRNGTHPDIALFKCVAMAACAGCLCSSTLLVTSGCLLGTLVHPGLDPIDVFTMPKVSATAAATLTAGTCGGTVYGISEGMTPQHIRYEATYERFQRLKSDIEEFRSISNPAPSRPRMR
jgi:hypothetical protein